MVNGAGTKFNCFLHIPSKAMKRKEKIESILREVQDMNRQLIYQVRMAESDLKVMVKHFYKNNYWPYVCISIDAIDSNCEVPEWELSTNRVNPFKKVDNGNKRLAEDSPENQTARKKNKEIPEWRVGEFLWEFLEGTKTKPDYETNDVEIEELEEDDALNAEETVDDETESADTAANLDNWLVCYKIMKYKKVKKIKIQKKLKTIKLKKN